MREPENPKGWTRLRFVGDLVLGAALQCSGLVAQSVFFKFNCLLDQGANHVCGTLLAFEILKHKDFLRLIEGVLLRGLRSCSRSGFRILREAHQPAPPLLSQRLRKYTQSGYQSPFLISISAEWAFLLYTKVTSGTRRAGVGG